MQLYNFTSDASSSLCQCILANHNHQNQSLTNLDAIYKIRLYPIIAFEANENVVKVQESTEVSCTSCTSCFEDAGNALRILDDVNVAERIIF